ncbi:MAG: pyridoxamine 5-phosphate oxidase family protein [Actinomycetia bacterium]|nr:pyridoxamine 5-phosphate oxidase family protein [Actinomycetes bacterium]
MTVETWLEELSEPICQWHLAHAPIGRLGVVVDGVAQIFPVNHVVDEETGHIVFPTNARTKMHAALAGAKVAFEVDGLDEGGRSAWSVLVVGRAEEVTEAAEVERAAEHRLALWAIGAYTHWVRIVPERTTGRRISVVE